MSPRKPLKVEIGSLTSNDAEGKGPKTIAMVVVQLLRIKGTWLARGKHPMLYWFGARRSGGDKWSVPAQSPEGALLEGRSRNHHEKV